MNKIADLKQLGLCGFLAEKRTYWAFSDLRALSEMSQNLTFLATKFYYSRPMVMVMVTIIE